MQRLSRNDPCPCGSGKKYKRCCLLKARKGTGKELSIEKRLILEAQHFFEQNFPIDKLAEAYAYFWDEFDPAEYLAKGDREFANGNFIEWCVYDWQVKHEKTLIDLFMESTKNLMQDELMVLKEMQASLLSLYEVQEVFPEKGLVLKDLLLGGDKYDVKEKTATRMLRKWDIFACRLLHLDGRYIIGGSVYPYSRSRKGEILEDIREVFGMYKKDNHEATLRTFLKRNSEIFNYHWYDPIQNPPKIKLVTTSGEPFLFSKAVFTLKDRKAVLEGLRKAKELKEDERDEFLWYAKPDKAGLATVLARMEVEDEKLVIECSSRKRLERAKKLVVKQVGDGVSHKADVLVAPEQAIKAAKGKPRGEPITDLPLEVQQAAYSQYMEKHYESWLNEKIPALKGKTPLQAVKTKAGRERLVELLKLYENSEEHNKRKGRPYYDISLLWERLGLK